MKYFVIFILVVFALISTILYQDAQDTSITLQLIDREQEHTTEVIRNEPYSLFIPEKPGYNFDGWYSDENGGIRLTDESGVSINDAKKNMTKVLYAQYKPIEYTVYINDILISDIYFSFDDVLPTLEPPTSSPTGKEFIGYQTSISKTLVTDSTGELLPIYETITEDNYRDFDIIEESIYLESYYEYQDYTINYFVGNDLVKSSQASFNDQIRNFYYPELENHTFIDWYLEPSLETVLKTPLLLDNTNLQHNLYAKFIESTPEVLNFTSINNDTAYKVSLNTDSLPEIVIPTLYFGKPVIEIGNFQNCSAESIYLPHTIESISIGAFKNCNQLVRINIPEGIETLPEESFMNTTSLESITFPMSLMTIDDFAFANSTSLDELHITENILTISSKAFIGTHNLKTITVSDKNSIYEMNNHVLMKIKGPYRVLQLFPAGLEQNSYEIPDQVTEINDYAFYQSQHLSEIIFNENTHYIGDYAFYELSRLTYINLTFNTNHPGFYIGDYAFSENLSLKTIILNNANPYQIPENFFNNSTMYLDIYVPTDSLDEYKAHLDWDNHSEMINSKNLIYGNFVLEEITINDTLGYEIKHYLSDQVDIVIPNIINSKPVLSIDAFAFSYKNLMETVFIPESVSIIKDYSFANCNNLVSVYLESTEPPSLSSLAFSNSDQTIYFYIMSSNINVINNYKSHVDWSAYAEYIYSNNE